MTEPISSARLSPLRKIIATQMIKAKQTVPRFRLAVDIDVGALVATRAGFSASSPGRDVAIKNCIIKACASALILHPAINAQLVGDEVRTYRDAHVSVVMAVDG